MNMNIFTTCAFLIVMKNRNFLINPNKTSNQTAIISDQVARDDVQEAQVSDQSAQASDQAAQVSDQVATADIQPRPFADYQWMEKRNRLLLFSIISEKIVKKAI